MEPNGTPRVAVLIPAAGAGARVGAGQNKLLLPLAGAPVLVHTVRAFQVHPAIERIGVIVRPEERPALERSFGPQAGRGKLLPWIAGGAQRQDSVYNGLAALASDPPAWVLVHDGARPCCRAALIGRVLAALGAADGAGGVVPVLPVSDTVRRLVGGRSEVVPREGLYRAQTPQGFHWDPLWAAYRAARARGLQGSDDAQVLEADGGTVAFVEGDPENIKITTAEDLRLADWLLRGRP